MLVASEVCSVALRGARVHPFYWSIRDIREGVFRGKDEMKSYTCLGDSAGMSLDHPARDCDGLWTLSSTTSHVVFHPRQPSLSSTLHPSTTRWLHTLHCYHPEHTPSLANPTLEAELPPTAPHRAARRIGTRRMVTKDRNAKLFYVCFCWESARECPALPCLALCLLHYRPRLAAERVVPRRPDH